MTKIAATPQFKACARKQPRAGKPRPFRASELLARARLARFALCAFAASGKIMNEDSTKKARARVNRINGQVTGIGKMIDEDRYCLDILNQIAAARAALDALGIEVLTSHLESCVVGHGTDSQHDCAKPLTQEELIEEVRAALKRFLK